jgi:hypothetical protein
MSIRSLSHGFAILCLLGSGAVWAGKPPPPPPPPPPGSACVDKGGDFPAMAYSRGVFAKGGNYQSTQFFVANSLGTCEVMVYDTADYNNAPVFLSFHFDFGTGNGTLAWHQLQDNGRTPAGRVVKVAQFHVEGRVVQGLPLSATTLYRFPTSLNTGISGVALSPQGNRVAFSEEHQTVSGGPWTLQILICNVSLPATPEACQQSLETALTTIDSGASGTHDLTIGVDGSSAERRERIYFIYRPNSGSVGLSDLVAIDRNGYGGWAQPVVLVDREQQYINNPLVGDTKTYLETPSALSQEGLYDLVLISSRNGTSARARVDIFDTAPNGGLRHDVSPNGYGYRPSWTMYPTTDATAPNVLSMPVLSLQPSPIQEIDPDGWAPQTSLHAQGYGVDSAN